jgi:RHS repeat-associated protein
VGNVTTESRSNGTQTTYGYDPNGRMTQIQHKKGSTLFAQVAYTRDSVVNTTQEVRALPLFPSITPDSISAAYDDTNQVMKWGSDNHTYDNDGNLTSITGTKSFSAAYDPENRVVTTNRSGVTTTYTYDGRGDRTKAAIGAQTHNYHYDPNGRFLFETDGSGQMVAYYIYHGSRLAAMKYSSASYFYHFDVGGNTVAITDGNGNITGAYAYEASGRVSNRSGSAPNPFTYAGAHGVMDEDNGLYFMKNRYYDADTGRFIQKDPIGLFGGTNLYGYVGNNPVENTDPQGTDPVMSSSIDPALSGVTDQIMSGTWDINTKTRPIDMKDNIASDTEQKIFAVGAMAVIGAMGVSMIPVVAAPCILEVGGAETVVVTGESVLSTLDVLMIKMMSGETAAVAAFITQVARLPGGDRFVQALHNVAMLLTLNPEVVRNFDSRQFSAATQLVRTIGIFLPR